MRQEMEIIKYGIRKSGYQNNLSNFGFTTDEICEIIQEEADDDDFFKKLENEWKRDMASIDMAQILIDDGSITEEEVFEKKREILLKDCENAFRDYYTAKLKRNNAEDLEKIKNTVITQYNVHVFRPDYYDKSVNKLQIEKANSVDLQKFIQASKSGFALCPFHGEKTPSFHITKNMYYCFGCGESGKTIDYIMKTRGFSFKEAVNYLCKI